jgi:5-methylcytosine-specific restriction endonuclease McrA
MGDITYPRVDGVVFIHGAFQRGDSIYLPRKGAKKILQYAGWEFRGIEFRKRSEPERIYLRREFNRIARSAFLAGLATHRRAKLLDGGLTEAEVEAMLDGEVPDRYEVHHILPLDDGGTNAFDNLILIRKSCEHTALTAYQNAFAKNLDVSQSVCVDYPVPCGDREYAIYPPVGLLQPQEIKLWPRRK